MRRKLIVNYLCLFALSIIYQYPSCIAQGADSAINSPSNRVYKVEEEPKLINDEDRDRKNQRRQLIEKQISAAPLRRKRELGSLRLQGSSNNLGEEKFVKRSDRQSGIRSSRKLSGSNKKDEEKLNSLNRIAAEVPENRDNQRLASKEEKRSSHLISKVAGSNDAVRSYLEEEDEEEEEEEPEENLEEYSDEEEELDSPENRVSGVYKDHKEESDSDKENVADNDDESEAPVIRKRETEENYEDVDEACGEVVEESSREEEIPEANVSIERRKRLDDERSKGGLDSSDVRSKRDGEPEVAAETATEEPNETGDNSSVKKEVKIENPAEAEESDADSERRKLDKIGDPNSDYGKKIADEIQQRIDSIKEEIKRDLKEREKIRDIEINNAKFDEIQSEMEEEEKEEDEGLDEVNSDPEKNTLKRSTAVAKADKRRVRRSGSKDLALQLRAVEGVERLDPDDFRRSKLRHESIKKRSAPIFGAVDAIEPLDGEPGFEKMDKRRIQSPMIIPEQAQVKIEDEFPTGISIDPDLILNSEDKERFKRSPVAVNHFARKRRASALVPEGRIAFLGYRPEDQEDDDDEEGGEFEDDGFQDRSSDLRQEKSYYADTRSEEASPGNYFLFPGVDQGRDPNHIVRRKRAGVHGGGATLGRRRERGKAKQLLNAKIASRRDKSMDRDKRQTGIDNRSYNRVSLVGSSQELSPQLATEYKEAFGGLQSDPGGALARFKRVKRRVIRGS